MKTVAKEMQADQEKIDDSGLEITLKRVLVGDDKPSQLYVNNKHKQANHFYQPVYVNLWVIHLNLSWKKKYELVLPFR